MGREISIFSDYHQKENSLTNYCGLLMKILYEDSPRRFQELLTTLIKTTDKPLIVGPIFSQQTKESKSIPDLSIIQRSFSIFFETKTTNWFYEDQIQRHIAGFNTHTETKILFLLSNFEHSDLEAHFKSQIDLAKNSGIILQPITFEDFIGALEQVCNTEYLANLLDEFKIYLDRNGHLPKWKYLLDVVNCGGTIHEVQQGAYMCPDLKGAYSHRRAKYFGTYSNKTVSEIFEIKAIVVVDKNLSAGKIKWKNVNEPDNTLIQEAFSKINMWQGRIEENKSVELQVFLLSDAAQTKFIKDTDGGMYQSKKYFWNIASDCRNSIELAAKLQNKYWRDFL